MMEYLPHLSLFGTTPLRTVMAMCMQPTHHYEATVVLVPCSGILCSLLLKNISQSVWVTECHTRFTSMHTGCKAIYACLPCPKPFYALSVILTLLSRCTNRLHHRQRLVIILVRASAFGQIPRQRSYEADGWKCDAEQSKPGRLTTEGAGTELVGYGVDPS